MLNFILVMVALSTTNLTLYLNNGELLTFLVGAGCGAVAWWIFFMNPHDLKIIEAARGYIALKIKGVKEYDPKLECVKNMDTASQSGHIKQSGSKGLFEDPEAHLCDKYPAIEHAISLGFFSAGAGLLGLIAGENFDPASNPTLGVAYLIVGVFLLAVGSYKGFANQTFFKVHMYVTDIFVNGAMAAGSRTGDFIISGSLNKGFDHKHISSQIDCASILIVNGVPSIGAVNFSNGEVFKSYACTYINPSDIYLQPTRLEVWPLQKVTLIFSHPIKQESGEQRVVYVLAVDVQNEQVD